MWVKQKRCELFGSEIGLAGNGSERRNVSACLCLIAINHVTGGAPTLGEQFAMFCISSNRSSSDLSRCGNGHLNASRT
jgi:hypothetical protein